MSDLLELAARCEAATGPDRELDVSVFHATEQGFIADGWDHLYPLYTASLDAAMTLLDKHGVLIQLSDIGADGLPLARVGRPDLEDAPVFTGIASCIMTETSPVAGLALALTAACLRARASVTPTGNPSSGTTAPHNNPGLGVAGEGS